MSVIHVAAAAIEDGEGRILITKRPQQVHQGGLWEFPGGKLESGETVLQGLERELREELDIKPLRTEPLIRITHHYEDRSILLDVYRVLGYAGEPKGMEGQPLAWSTPEAMNPEDFPAADRPIINALQLPDRYLITGADPFQPGLFIARLEQSLRCGLRLVQLRAHQLDDEAYLALAETARDVCRAYAARLLLNRPEYRETWVGFSDGIHLTSHQLKKMRARPADADWVGASCHSLDELQRAERLGLEYALLSPVQATASHPDASPLGWDRFAAWVAPLNLPIYALGGMGDATCSEAKRYGAQGVAAISGFWPD